MGWLTMLMPVSGILVFWPGLIILGFGVGMIGGFFGMGGGWMVTPGLNILGFPMAFAIGTDIVQMTGPSLISTLRHTKFGNVDYKLGLIMVGGTVTGFECGAQVVMWLERLGRVETYVRSGYVILLALVAWLVFADFVKKRRKDRDAVAAGVEWHKTLHKIRIPPMMYFPKAGIRCSAWLPISVAFTTGLLAGVLGIGGGLIRMPALIYLIGCPTHIAVGTDLFEVAISGLYGAASYSYKGRTEVLAALVMLAGASFGAQIGSVATKYAKGYGIRLFFGISVLGCAVSIVLKLMASVLPASQVLLDSTATVLILGLVGTLSLYILSCFVRGVREELVAKKHRAKAPLLHTEETVEVK
jgi:uncharacterized membrane protein YfcA